MQTPSFPDGDPQTLIWHLLCAHRPHAGDTRMHEASGCLCPWGPQSRKTPLSVQGASSDLKHMGEGAAVLSPEAGFLFGMGRGVRAVLQHRRRDDWRVSGRSGHCGLTAPPRPPRGRAMEDEACFGSSHYTSSLCLGVLQGEDRAGPACLCRGGLRPQAPQSGGEELVRPHLRLQELAGDPGRGGGGVTTCSSA